MSTDDKPRLLFREPQRDDFPYFLLTYDPRLTDTPWSVLCVPSWDTQAEMVALLLFPTMTSAARRDEIRASVTRHATRMEAEDAIRQAAAERGGTTGSGVVLVQEQASPQGMGN